MKKICLIFISLFFFSLKIAATELKIKEIRLLSVNSAITPATFDYLKQNFEHLPESSLIVLRLNTPGGLVTTTKDIITLIGSKKRPFVVWITPEGASASSAGAIIASSAHFIFMSPGTNMGAATPVGLGDDIKESDGRKKALNDLMAMVKSLSTSRSRPSIPFEKMISEAKAYTAQEALDLKIIDGIISSEEEIPSFLEKKIIHLDGVPTTLQTLNPGFKEFSPSTGQKILEVLANPTTAYILFLIGVALLYFEFQAPGGFIAGAIGVCFLILSGISFQVLPLNWGALGLMVAGLFLIILEIFIISYGLLLLSGLISFTIGSLFLFHGEEGLITTEYPVILSALAGVVASIALITWYLFKDRKKQHQISDFFLPIGARGQVLKKIGKNEYQIKVRGEIWNATSEEELDVHSEVEVSFVDADKLTIQIKRTT